MSGLPVALLRFPGAECTWIKSNSGIQGLRFDSNFHDVTPPYVARECPSDDSLIGAFTAPGSFWPPVAEQAGS